MGDKFAYSSCIGMFIFDENGSVIDKALFADPAAANAKLESGEWLEEEKQVLSKHGALMFLGFKSEKPEGVKFTNDIRKLEAATAKLAVYEQKTGAAIIKIAKSKIKASVWEDELIAQAISAIQEIDKATSMLAKRLREWNGLRNPEMSAEISDNSRFVKEAMESTPTEMGADIGEEDEAEIRELARNAIGLLKLRARQEKYIESKMKKACPNLLAVAGAPIGAKLIAAAGSLRQLAVMPASKLQLLGAERSMFNFLRKKSKKMPRFGILHEHKLVASAPEREKGRAARLLADKITIAARVDYFKGAFIGEKLLKEIEGKLK